MYSLGKEQCRACMPEIMESGGVWQTCSFQQRLPRAIMEVLATDSRACFGAEDPFTFPRMNLQRPYGFVGQGYAPFSLLGFGRIDRSVVDGPPYLEYPSLQIHILPLKPEQFSLSETCGYGK